MIKGKIFDEIVRDTRTLTGIEEFQVFERKGRHVAVRRKGQRAGREFAAANEGGCHGPQGKDGKVVYLMSLRMLGIKDKKRYVIRSGRFDDILFLFCRMA